MNNPGIINKSNGSIAWRTEVIIDESKSQS